MAIYHWRSNPNTGSYEWNSKVKVNSRTTGCFPLLSILLKLKQRGSERLFSSISREAAVKTENVWIIKLILKHIWMRLLTFGRPSSFRSIPIFPFEINQVVSEHQILFLFPVKSIFSFHRSSCAPSSSPTTRLLTQLQMRTALVFGPNFMCSLNSIYGGGVPRWWKKLQ